MGYYVNPPGTTKELWLRQNAILIHPEQMMTYDWNFVPEGHLPVVWVDNGWMTAAGVCYCEQEFQAFMDPYDSRPRLLFMARIEDLLKVVRNMNGDVETGFIHYCINNLGYVEVIEDDKGNNPNNPVVPAICNNDDSDSGAVS